MNYKGVLLVLLVGMLVVPVMATTTTINATFSNYVSRASVNENWTTIRNGAGTIVGDPGDTLFARATATSSASQYSRIQDIGLTFNLVSIPPDQTIESVKIGVWGLDESYGLGNPTLVLTSYNPTDKSSYAASDYPLAKWGTTPLSPNITTANWVNSGWNNLTFYNGSGNINVGTLNSYGLRLSWVTDNVTPTWSDGLSTYYQFDDQLGSYPPFMEITYTIGGNAPVASFSTNVTGGSSPLGVGFTDTSTNTPTSWNYSFQNYTPGNNTQIWWTTTQNSSILLGNGNWIFKLNASNLYGYNITPTNYWVNVTQPYISATTHPLTYINDTFILPYDDTNLPSVGTSLITNATRGQYVATSFVVKPNASVYGVTITATDLSDGLGQTIPKSNLDIRTVKSIYHPGNFSYEPGIEEYGIYLQPTLLLKDDEIIQVDYELQQQTIHVYNDTFDDYVHIDNTSIGQWQSDYEIYDSPTAEGFPQPFFIGANENKQVWITTHIPSSQTYGNYTGNISVDVDGTISNVTLNVRVLPFALSNATKEYSLFYQGVYNASETDNLSFTSRPPTNFAADLQDMKNHSINYPRIYADASDTGQFNNVNSSLQLMVDTGFPTDKLYLGFGIANPGDQGWVTSMTTKAKASADRYGYTKLYVTGSDEPTYEQMTANRESYATAIAQGVGIWVTSNRDDTFNYLGDRINVSVMSGDRTPLGYNTTERNQWHGAGQKIFIYLYPQSGINYPETYRKNYGLELWNAGYDGEMAFAYQQAFGQTVWNPFDNAGGSCDGYSGYCYRDMTFTYPTTSGSIPSVSWELLREGIDDTRYADTLTAYEGSNTTALSIINDGITAGSDMSVIRSDLIDEILDMNGTYPGLAPTAHFYMNISGTSPVLLPDAEFIADDTTIYEGDPVQFTDLSTNSPTSWQWYWLTNENTPNSNQQNPTSYQFTTEGYYNVRLKATNAYGSNWENKTAYINVSSTGVPSPRSDFSANVTSGTIPLIVRFTDNSTNSPTTCSWYWMTSENSPNSNSCNVTYTFETAGTYNVRHYVSNAYGSDWENKTGYIVASSPAPVADFTVNETEVALGGSVQLTDLSTNTPTSWHWQVSNAGGTVFDYYTQNVTTSASNFCCFTGDINVTLESTNAYGSGNETKLAYIRVTGDENSTYGTDYNPTGDPIGGGAGYSDIKTSGDYTVTTAAQLITALGSAYDGQTIFIPSTATIDLTAQATALTVPAGVTLASDRGYSGHLGGLIKRDTSGTIPLATLRAGGDDVRITGLRIQGPHGTFNGDYGDDVKAGVQTADKNNTEIDNNEIYNWSYAGVDVENTGTGSYYTYVHHNNIHDVAGMGYGYAVITGFGTTLVEGNTFDYNRHALSGYGGVGESYEARYNNVGTTCVDTPFDVHAEGTWSGGGLSGRLYKIHHNTVLFTGDYTLDLIGTPSEGMSVYNNRLVNGILVRNGLTRVSMTNNYVGGTLEATGPITEV